MLSPLWMEGNGRTNFQGRMAGIPAQGKLFGSITSQQIAEQLSRKGFTIDRRKVVLDEPIKSVGKHVVTIRLRGEVSAEVTVDVSAVE